ncbi:MAG: hypothetical protein DRN15_07290 [Thermoprotei archaeon]|nr:MAG: hypothetical protein DRN15_07290 [Thermoprotei archaeon]
MREARARIWTHIVENGKEYDFELILRGSYPEEQLRDLAQKIAGLLYQLSKDGLSWEVIELLRRVYEGLGELHPIEN